MHHSTNTSPTVSLTGKVALITGAAGGIGLEIARVLASTGCTVVLADLDDAIASERAREIGVEQASSVHLDVADAQSVDTCVAELTGRYGRIDVAVNNAGVLAKGRYDETSNALWMKLMAVNLGGMFNCVQAIAPVMCRQHSGCILNISSVSAFRGGGTIGNVWYGATKAAISAATMGLARELGPSGVRVNAIAPSVVATEMLKGALTPENAPEISSLFPLRRLATKRDVANLALFLASNLSSFITGQVIAVDGGLLCA